MVMKKSNERLQGEALPVSDLDSSTAYEKAVARARKEMKDSDATSDDVLPVEPPKK